MHRRIFFSYLFVNAAFLSGSFALAQSTHPGLIDRMLVQAKGDPRVYYLQDGAKRWITNESAFLAQGFGWSDITFVDRARLDAYPDGAPISGTTFLGLAVDRVLLPDLAPVAPYDLRVVTEDGRSRLRFTATFWNRGKGAIELNAQGGASVDGDYPAYQRVFRPDGSFTERYVGTLFWHDVHAHYHYEDFGNYVLRLIRPTPGTAAAGTVTTNKTTFCLRDDLSIGAPSDGAKQARAYGGCRGHRQGVSVGWADVYPFTLADQYVDVTGLPAGTYALSFEVDPHMTFAESRRDNNESVTLIELDPSARTVRVIATGSPYEADSNRFPDGMLVKAAGDPRVYVMRNNKKRWLRSEEVFLSYGYSWGGIFELPPGVVEALPSERLVRVRETGTIYVLNEAGWKRRILNPDVFRSYGFIDGDMGIINQVELNGYPEADLIVKPGTDRVFSIGARKEVARLDTLRALGYDPVSVHVVNETDFRAYALSTMAQGLVIPWDIAFLPDGDLLVTERTGTLRRIGAHPASFPLPDVFTGGEGGLMGIALHPNFALNKYVYLYYTTNGGTRKNRVDRFRLDSDRLIHDRAILENIPGARYHDGGQIEFGPDGKLYIATGDATDPDAAQDTRSLAGKILRLNDDGSIPPDNPFGNAVWSYGHRNPQGLAWDDQGRLYAAEHGPTGEFGLCCRDEINLIVKGGNYGWPVITGSQTRDGLIAPIATSGGSVTWAPSGLAHADGSLFFSGLRASTLYELPLREDGTAGPPRPFLAGAFGRLRAAVAGPDGQLYVTTSNRDGRGTARTGDDKLIRVHVEFLR